MFPFSRFMLSRTGWRGVQLDCGAARAKSKVASAAVSKLWVGDDRILI